MNLIRLAITRPIAVVAAVFMVLLFGWVALQRIPIQLAPDVRQPVVNVNTNWPGAAPAEVEREIINRQEDVFKGLEGLQGINSTARTGRGTITLEFAPGQNMDRALLLIANRLDRVTGYPEEADEPTLSTSGSEDNAIAWFVISRTGRQHDADPCLRRHRRGPGQGPCRAGRLRCRRQRVRRRRARDAHRDRPQQAGQLCHDCR